MPYLETKVYFDGSHYIAIPHTTRPKRRRAKPQEEEITVKEDTKKGAPELSDAPPSVVAEEKLELEQITEDKPKIVNTKIKEPEMIRTETHSDQKRTGRRKSNCSISCIGRPQSFRNACGERQFRKGCDPISKPKRR